MATKPLKSIKFPDLPDTYTVPQPDGSYQQMTVGNAEQLVATVGVQDKAPYNFRTSGGSADIGDREVDKVVGGTVAWNQLAPELNATNWSTESGVTISYADGVATFSAATAGNGIFSGIMSATAGHKYFMHFDAKCGELFTIRMSLATTGITTNYTIQAANTWESASAIISNNTTGSNRIYIYGVSTTYTDLSLKNVQLIDLTQMFGSTIADYIYSLEQGTAGAGVAYFRKLFPKPYYAYNAGTLMHVQTSAHKMTGFNQWDEEWEQGTYSESTGDKVSLVQSEIRSKNYIPVFPSTAYHKTMLSTGRLRVFYYDMNKNYIDYNTNLATFTTPANCYFLTLCTIDSYGTTYNNDICINLHWDGERDGEYEPYEEHTYPLDSDLVLRGIPKLDANNNLYYDGDEYASDGTVTRKYGILDLGSINWAYNSSNNRFDAPSNTPSMKSVSQSNIANILCVPYVTTSFGALYQGADKSIAVDAKLIRIRDTAYTDAAAFKIAMSGVYLVYELATPTTESADPYQNPQIVNDWGTEEYVDTRTVPIPVGHDTTYRANLRAKLEMAPDSPSDGDGDYIVRQTNGQNVYVKLVKELPTAPTTDGTYHLKCTVASGTATLTWEADE